MATKKSPRYKLVTVPLYDKPVHVVEGSTIWLTLPRARRRWPDLEVSTRMSSRHTASARPARRTTRRPAAGGASPGYVAHEVPYLHAANFVLQNVGIKANTVLMTRVSCVLQFIVDAVAPWLTSRSTDSTGGTDWHQRRARPHRRRHQRSRATSSACG